MRTWRKIYDPHAPAGTLAWQVGKKASELVAPIGVAGRIGGDMSQAKKVGLGLLGVSSRKHGAERIAQEIVFSRMSQDAPTPEDQARSIQHRQLLEAAQKGNMAPAGEALSNGQITKRELHSLERASQGLHLVDTVRNFTPEELQRVYDVATPEQKAMLEP